MKNCELMEVFLIKALERFYERDQYLIENKAHERSCVFRIAHYLNNMLEANPAVKKWGVDVEYNRLPLTASTTNGRNKKSLRIVRPDLIVHIRDTNKYNLLVAEFKCSWNRFTKKQIEKDINTLNGLVNGDCEYKRGVLIKLTDDKPEIIKRIIK